MGISAKVNMFESDSAGVDLAFGSSLGAVFPLLGTDQIIVSLLNLFPGFYFFCLVLWFLTVFSRVSVSQVRMFRTRTWTTWPKHRPRSRRSERNYRVMFTGF